MEEKAVTKIHLDLTEEIERKEIENKNSQNKLEDIKSKIQLQDQQYKEGSDRKNMLTERKNTEIEIGIQLEAQIAKQPCSNEDIKNQLERIENLNKHILEAESDIRINTTELNSFRFQEKELIDSLPYLKIEDQKRVTKEIFGEYITWPFDESLKFFHLSDRTMILHKLEEKEQILMNKKISLEEEVKRLEEMRKELKKEEKDVLEKYTLALKQRDECVRVNKDLNNKIEKTISMKPEDLERQRKEFEDVRSNLETLRAKYKAAEDESIEKEKWMKEQREQIEVNREKMMDNIGKTLHNLSETLRYTDESLQNIESRLLNMAQNIKESNQKFEAAVNKNLQEFQCQDEQLLDKEKAIIAKYNDLNAQLGKYLQKIRGFKKN